jgi:hypothetical protein
MAHPDKVCVIELLQRILYQVFCKNQGFFIVVSNIIRQNVPKLSDFTTTHTLSKTAG